MTPLTNFCCAAISSRMRSMCPKPAQFVRNGRLLNLFFGSGRTAHWLPRYGRFKLGVSGMCMYVHVYVGICVYVHVYIGICRCCTYLYIYMHVCISMPSVSASIACIGPLGRGNHHSIPKTPPRDPTPRGTHSGHPRACALPLFDPIPIPPSDPIFRFFLQESVLGPVLPRP